MLVQKIFSPKGLTRGGGDLKDVSFLYILVWWRLFLLLLGEHKSQLLVLGLGTGVLQKHP